MLGRANKPPCDGVADAGCSGAEVSVFRRVGVSSAAVLGDNGLSYAICYCRPGLGLRSMGRVLIRHGCRTERFMASKNKGIDASCC